MRQYPISYINPESGLPSGHYAAASNCLNNYVLVQVQDEFGCQVRVKLNKEEAKHLSSLILEAIKDIEEDR